MLKIDGSHVMKLGKLEPGPKIGQILAVLLEDVLEDPKKNNEEDLAKRIKELNKLPEKELHKMTEKAKKRKNEFESGLEQKIKKKFYIK
jgi:hypothetical protein